MDLAIVADFSVRSSVFSSGFSFSEVGPPAALVNRANLPRTFIRVADENVVAFCHHQFTRPRNQPTRRMFVRPVAAGAANQNDRPFGVLFPADGTGDVAPGCTPEACDPGVILHPRHRVLAEKSKCEVGASKIPQPLVLQDDASRLLLRDFPNLGVGERTGSLPLQMLVWLRCESHLLPYLPLISFPICRELVKILESCCSTFTTVVAAFFSVEISCLRIVGFKRVRDSTTLLSFHSLTADSISRSRLEASRFKSTTQSWPSSGTTHPMALNLSR